MNPIIGRLLQLLFVASERGSLESIPDFITLVRHLLMARRKGGNRPSLRVPADVGWPNVITWKEFGFHVTKAAEQLIVEAIPWEPSWLGNLVGEGEDIFSDEFAGEKIRQSSSIPMDPFLADATGFKSYVCPGQREAVRSLLFMPPGSTLIINLPTGSGKSLVAQVPIILRGLNNGLTLFVVPTNALALDLARRTHELLEFRYSSEDIPEMAWRGDCTEEVKSGIRKRIRQGSQGILFTSPEAVVGSLRPVLNDAVRSGSFKYMVIDEAHLVAQWGDSFRPAFQEISGVRRGFLRECGGEPFRTVLMSATFSSQTIDTLDALFGPPDQVQMVSAVHLRPEPRYFSCHSKSWAEKKDRVLELLRYVPRPFILYVTERKHADYWLNTLEMQGYARVAAFHGNTPGARREEIIKLWVSDQLDGIIATSAFGVGMDKQDVRTVIHAAVPETLDRYYQEVGRGGRDGYASLSVVIYDDRDESTARSMSRPALIGDDNAFERWNAMLHKAHQIEGEDLFALDLTVLPSHLGQETEYNVAWNMRTLILMARVGLIELESSAAGVIERLPDEDDDTFEARIKDHWETYFTTLPVRTLDERTLHRDHFEAVISTERNRSGQVATSAFNNLMAALRGQKDMSDVLSMLFTSHKPGRMVIVSKTCRGCEAESHHIHESGNSYQIPVGVGIERVVAPQIDLWHRRFSWLDGTPTIILCPKSESSAKEEVLKALRVLVSMFGVREIATSSEQWEGHSGLRGLYNDTPGGVLIMRSYGEDADLMGVLPIPRVTLLLPWKSQPIPDKLLMLDRPLHIIFAPDDVPSAHPLRLYRDDASNYIKLDDFLEIATQ